MSNDLVHVPALDFDFSAALDAVSNASDETVARLTSGGSGVVALLDVSDSMADRAGGGTTKSRWQAMVEAFAPLRGKCTCVAFSSGDDVDGIKGVKRLHGDEPIPGPGAIGYGGTRVSLGLKEAIRLKPARTVLICDGETYDKAECREAVAQLSGVLDTVFVGSDGDVSARMFLQELAQLGGGTFTDLGGNALALTAAVAPLMLTA